MIEDILDFIFMRGGIFINRVSEIDFYRPGDLKLQYGNRGFEEWEFLEF